jgi:uncharacterized protein with FMN-binding domain
MKLPDVQIDNVKLKQLPDGSYRGEYARGPVKIVAEVLGKQTLQLDAISGATLSSNVILKAVQVALDEGTE